MEKHAAEALRKAVTGARLRDVDIASRLGVDPKTVQRWLHGRLPQAQHRRSLSGLLDAHEYDLWPQLAGAATISSELLATYDYRAAVPRDVWFGLFDRATVEISLLVYSGLFIAEDVELVRLLAQKAADDVTIRLLLGDSDSDVVAERGAQEGIGEAMGAKIRNAIVLYRPLLAAPGVDLRLHQTVLYNSLYLTEHELIVNQHVYGAAAAHAPVLHLRRQGESEMFATYSASFERVWSASSPLALPA